MANDPAIRTAQPDDAAVIAAIHAASWQATYRGKMPDAYLDTLTDDARLPMWNQVLISQPPRMDVLVLELDREVAGFAWTGPVLADDEDDGTGELYAIYLRPGLEGRGLGRHLIAEAERSLASRGFAQARLRVLRDNHHARRFYEAAGWVTTGEERHDEVLGVPVIELTYHRTLTTAPGNIREGTE
jgi:ribosomal protein S18 acetylase RimI-like enzyme